MNRLLLAVLCFAALSPALADEGMWLFNAPPTAQLKAKYDFEPSHEWLDHLQKASVRFNSGGSGSFVSAGGLCITNHHVGADALQKFSDEQHNYLRDGFYAASQAEEKPCTDLELNVLMSIEDVTARVSAAVHPGLNAGDAVSARRAVIADIEKESKEKTGLRSDVVTLYQGGAYHLYRFKRYTDVRLVFAPEAAIAFYGGDPDNFEYPRYDLDICIFRAYEDGKPAQPENFLKWSAHGAAEHELVFISGHPGSTSRELTLAELTDARDRAQPSTLNALYRRETLLHAYGERSFENARRAREEYFGVQNSRKARDGREAGLLDPELFGKLVAREKDLRARISAEGLPPVDEAYAAIAQAQAEVAKNAPLFGALEGTRGAPRAFDSTLFVIARTLTRAVDERAKPNGQRLPAYRDSSLPSLELQLFSEEAIHDDLETLTLADSLTDFAETFGADNDLVKSVLAGKSPRARAAELIAGTRLKEVSLRRKLYAGDAASLAAQHDPMLELARLVDAPARAARKTYEEQDELKQQAHARIANARFAVEGTSNYPDATFTLRLSYGTVEGYEENGRKVPAFTEMGGAYTRSAEHADQEPFKLPKRWVDGKGSLDLSTPFNFVCNADIIGGNSGSPTVNKAGEFVGIIFDGNIQSLPLDYGYTDKMARAVSVDSRAIIEALEKVYHAEALVRELQAK